MGVRGADEAITVERRAHPVHSRIRGQAGLHREYFSGQIAVTVGYRVEAGPRPENGEPWCPDMRRNQVAAGAAFQRDLKQVTRVKAEDRPSVRGQVADLRQGRGDPIGGLEAGRVKQMVHFTGALAPPVDSGDLHREQETYWLVTGGRYLAAQVSFQ